MIEVLDVPIDSAAAREAAAFVAQHPAATAYASPAWLAVMRRFKGVSAWYEVARHQGRIAGVLPVVERPHPRAALLPAPLRPVRRESLSHDCYGGPLLAPGLDGDAAARVLDALVERFARFPALLATLYLPAWADLDPVRRRLEGVHGFQARHGFPLVVKPLAGLTPETLAATYHKKQRNAVGAARKRGVVVERAGGTGDLLELWDLLDETMTHAGIPLKFSKDFVVEGGRELVSAGAGDLWLARLDGVPVAGAFMLRTARTTCWWLGAAARDEEMQQHRPMNLVLHTAFVDAVERGHEQFEMGGLGSEGLRLFKTRWGVREYEQVTLERSYLGLADRLRDARDFVASARARAFGGAGGADKPGE